MSIVLKPAGPEKIVFQGKIVEIVQTVMEGGGKQKLFERARRSPGVRVIVINEAEQKILLTKEFRYELNDYSYRLPGGKVVDTLKEFHALLETDGVEERAQQRAIEEVEEEAGLRLDSVKHIHTSKVGSTIEWDLLYYMATDFTASTQTLELGESIEVSWHDYAAAKELCLDGSLAEERSALVLLRELSKLLGK